MDIRLLHWGRSWENLSRSSGKWQFEYHPYYQLEFCVRGKILVRTPERDIVLHAGDMLLLPPGVGHNVHYPEVGNEFYSLKFETSPVGSSALFICSSRFNEWCLQSLRSCHSAEARLALPIDPETREIVEGVLLVCMKHFVRKNQLQDVDKPPLFRKIREATLRCGCCINVAECAGGLKMTPPQLNYQFAKELKLFKLSPEEYSVKKCIDEALLYLIDRYLDFTDFSLGTIARQMKFNNVYTFSRFYKRLTGIAPSERRKQPVS